MSNKKWTQNEKGEWILSFCGFYDDFEEIARIYQDEDGDYLYDCSISGIEQEYLDEEDIEVMKEVVEEGIIDYYQGEIDYYEALMRSFKDE